MPEQPLTLDQQIEQAKKDVQAAQTAIEKMNSHIGTYGFDEQVSSSDLWRAKNQLKYATETLEMKETQKDIETTRAKIQAIEKQLALNNTLTILEELKQAKSHLKQETLKLEIMEAQRQFDSAQTTVWASKSAPHADLDTEALEIARQALQKPLTQARDNAKRELQDLQRKTRFLDRFLPSSKERLAAATAKLKQAQQALDATRPSFFDSVQPQTQTPPSSLNLGALQDAQNVLRAQAQIMPDQNDTQNAQPLLTARTTAASTARTLHEQLKASSPSTDFSNLKPQQREKTQKPRPQ